MKENRLEVICSNSEIQYFNKGIVGLYNWIGIPTKDEEEPEYTIKAFFTEGREFKGILLVDHYRDELKDEFDCIINLNLPIDIKEYDILFSVEIKDGEISYADYDLCTCYICKDTSEWNEFDIWECEECNTLVCSDCMYEYNPEASSKVGGISHLDKILCKECFNLEKADTENNTEALV